MQRPYLRIIAGCNGAGKSTYSKTFLSKKERITPFDYDKRYAEIYASMFDSDIRETMAKNRTTNEFTEAIEHAFKTGSSFCYETNFDQQPLVWAKEAKDLGYILELVFFCLRSQQMAKDRVRFRVEVEKGHHVINSDVRFKWKEGYKNLNEHFSFFDSVTLVDNSSENKSPTLLVQLKKNIGGEYDLIKYTENIPSWAKRRAPRIYALWHL